MSASIISQNKNRSKSKLVYADVIKGYLQSQRGTPAFPTYCYSIVEALVGNVVVSSSRNQHCQEDVLGTLECAKLPSVQMDLNGLDFEYF